MNSPFDGSTPSTRYASVVRGSSSDSDADNFSSSWLCQFQRVSENEALRIALEESARVSINFRLLAALDNQISGQKFC